MFYVFYFGQLFFFLTIIQANQNSLTKLLIYKTLHKKLAWIDYVVLIINKTKIRSEVSTLFLKEQFY